MSTDAELLQRYVRNRDERAFAELVRRHLGVVYGAALRRTGGRAHLAEEIAQRIFADLARKAAVLSHHPALTGWLHRSTRYAAIDALRAEQRGQKLVQTLHTLPTETSVRAEEIEWGRLRPVLDEALDELKDSDRAAMLLRYFEGLSFAEVGARLNLSENAARMRTERALEKLRVHLSRRGVTSTAAALGLVLSSPALVAAPATLAASVNALALAGAPPTSAFLSILLMSKIATPALSAVLAAGVTALVWISVVPSVSAEELAAVRAENARLTQATAAGAPASAGAAVASEYAATATSIAQAMVARQTAKATSPPPAVAETSVTPRGHRNLGNATAHDAALSFARAGDICDPDEIAKLVYFDSDARAQALAILATMPEAMRTLYPTPEAFYGLLLAASQLAAPPPGADVIENSSTFVELSPGRVAMRRKGSDRNFHEYQLTDTGWKHVLPLGGVKGLPNNLNSQTLAKLVQR